MDRRVRKTEKLIKTLGEEAVKVEESVHTMVESVSSVLAKLKEYLEITNKLETVGSLSDYPVELEDFRQDVSKYGTGVFLWQKSKYPNVVQKFEEIGLIVKILNIDRSIDIVNEYKSFINMVKTKEHLLYEDERRETNNKVFEGTIEPIKILITKLEIWRSIHENTTIYLDMFVKAVPAMLEYLKVLGRIAKIESAKIRVRTKGRKKDPRIFKKINSQLRNIPKEFDKKCPEDVKKTIQEIHKFSDIIKSDINYIKTIKLEDCYNLLELSKDLYELDLDISRYLLRLRHIYIEGNRDFPQNLILNPAFVKIKKILDYYLSKELSKECPILSKLLIGFIVSLKSLRIIESHSTPKIILSENKKFMKIAKKGKMGTKKAEIEKIETILRTNVALIEALRIFRELK